MKYFNLLTTEEKKALLKKFNITSENIREESALDGTYLFPIDGKEKYLYITDFECFPIYKDLVNKQDLYTSIFRQFMLKAFEKRDKSLYINYKKDLIHYIDTKAKAEKEIIL